MPISADPNQTTEVRLEADEHLPESARTVFTYRFLTTREVLRRGELIKQADDATDNPTVVRALTEAVGIGLVAWKNLRRPDGSEIASDPVNPSAVADSLSGSELWELARGIGRAVALSEQKKRNCWLQPTSSLENSAPTATPVVSAATPTTQST